VNASTTNEEAPLILNNSFSLGLLDVCDRECHKGCMEIKKFVPARIVIGCVRAKCGCKYDINRSISEQVIVANQT
jgi:hypothetical protein